MTRKGVWDLQEVRDKYLQDLWADPISLYGFGAGTDGKLGLNSNTARSSPTQVPGNNWSMVSNREGGSVGVKDDGTLWVWGGNASGSLGLNESEPASYSSPKQVGTNTNWNFAAASGERTAAITSSGEMYVWGRNQNGCFATNVQEDFQSSPVQVPGTTWAECAFGGGNQGIFRKTDGTIWASGQNNEGQLGLNTPTYYSSPVQIGTQTNWSKIMCGGNSSWGMTDSGALFAWGQSVDGSLGFNQGSVQYSSPKQLPGTWSEWSVSKTNGLAVKTDGTLWSWGENVNGSLGHDNTSQYSSPKQVGTDTTWAIVETNRGNLTNDASTLAIKTDGTMWAWGTNTSGELGLNDNANYWSPKQVGGTKWSQTRGQLTLGLTAAFGMTKTLTPSQL